MVGQNRRLQETVSLLVLLVEVGGSNPESPHFRCKNIAIIIINLIVQLTGS